MLFRSVPSRFAITHKSKFSSAVHAKAFNASDYRQQKIENESSFPVRQLYECLERDHLDMKKQYINFLTNNEQFRPQYNIPLKNERELALQRLKAICENKFISVFDFNSDPLRIFTAHELAAIVDASMTTKMTVQFNLFGGTVLKIGTNRHHELLKGNQAWSGSSWRSP